MERKKNDNRWFSTGIWDNNAKPGRKHRHAILSLTLTYIIILLYSVNLQAQIHIQLKNQISETYYLQQIKGDRLNTLDSAFSINNDLKFEWKENYDQGMYRLFNGKEGVVFWAGEEEIKLKVSEPLNQDSLAIVNSQENQIWKNYIGLKNKNYQNLDLLNPIINWYDKESDFYQVAVEEFEKQQTLVPNFVQNMEKEYSDSWLFPFIKADLKPVLPLGLELEKQKKYLQEHWFDGVDWNENSLMYSDILTHKITEYLGLYANQNFSKAQLELAFKVAVDQIIPKIQGNPDMYAFIMDYLVRGFERYNFEEVILHIAMNYPPPEQQCENEERKSEALARLEKYESMQIGQTAPDIELPSMQGKNIKISETQQENILLVFWASWCPHCKQLLPQLNGWYTKEKQDQWQVYTISLDTDKPELENFLKEKNIQLETLCNYQGWETKAAIDYNIYATPTMIVLDRDLRILKKPSSIRELD